MEFAMETKFIVNIAADGQGCPCTIFMFNDGASDERTEVESSLKIRFWTAPLGTRPKKAWPSVSTSSLSSGNS